MGIFERFNPADEKYKELEDLPKRKQQKFKKAKEGGFVRKEALETPEEAMLQQDYATNLAGLDFNEMVDGESMKEAEKIYKELKDAKFDFSSINWESLDLKDLKHIENPKERAKAAFDKLVSFDDPRILELHEKLKDMKKVNRKIVIALFALLFSTALSAGLVSIQNAIIDKQDREILKKDKIINKLSRGYEHPRLKDNGLEVIIPNDRHRDMEEKGV